MLGIADVAGNDHGVIELRRECLEARAGGPDAAPCSGDDRALHEADATAG